MLHSTIGKVFLGWGALFFLLLWLSYDFLEDEKNPNQTIASTINEEGEVTIHLAQNRSGHYIASGSINQHPVVFLLDTGATYVAVDEDIAKQLGLKKGVQTIAATANGPTQAWRTTIAEINLGDIRQYSIPAIILPNLGKEVLLGMSFLKRLTMIQQDNQLIIRQQH